jgi:hypothetical protein
MNLSRDCIVEAGILHCRPHAGVPRVSTVRTFEALLESKEKM